MCRVRWSSNSQKAIVVLWAVKSVYVCIFTIMTLLEGRYEGGPKLSYITSSSSFLSTQKCTTSMNIKSRSWFHFGHSNPNYLRQFVTLSETWVHHYFTKAMEVPSKWRIIFNDENYSNWPKSMNLLYFLSGRLILTHMQNLRTKKTSRKMSVG